MRQSYNLTASVAFAATCSGPKVNFAIDQCQETNIKNHARQNTSATHPHRFCAVREMSPLSFDCCDKPDDIWANLLGTTHLVHRGQAMPKQASRVHMQGKGLNPRTQGVCSLGAELCAATTKISEQIMPRCRACSHMDHRPHSYAHSSGPIRNNSSLT